MAVEISSWADLQAINSGLSGDYILMNDLGSGDTGYDTYASSSANSGEGWVPLGNISSNFTGDFNGYGFNISDLFINRINSNWQGLFGYTNNCTISNIRLLNVDITGNDRNGALAGYILYSFINNCNSSGIIYGDSYTGGLIGDTKGTVNNCYSSVNITGTSSYRGGLFGFARESFTTNSYSTGSISNSSNNGGLVGYTWSTSFSNCFWDKETSNRSSSAAGTGKTTSEMQTQSTFTNWDFDTIWEINTSEYPTLQVFNSSPEPSNPTVQGINQITGVQSITI